VQSRQRRYCTALAAKANWKISCVKSVAIWKYFGSSLGSAISSSPGRGPCAAVQHQLARGAADHQVARAAARV
jgi:hypothetical protein